MEQDYYSSMMYIIQYIYVDIELNRLITKSTQENKLGALHIGIALYCMRDATYFRQKISSILNFREKTHNVSWFDSHKREKMFGKTKKLHFFINSNYSSIQYISWNDPVMFTWKPDILEENCQFL